MDTQDETQNTPDPTPLRPEQREARSILFSLMPYHVLVYCRGPLKVMNRQRLVQLIVGAMLPWSEVEGAITEMHKSGKFKATEMDVVAAELKTIGQLCRRENIDYE